MLAYLPVDLLLKLLIGNGQGTIAGGNVTMMYLLTGDLTVSGIPRVTLYSLALPPPSFLVLVSPIVCGSQERPFPRISPQHERKRCGSRASSTGREQHELKVR